MVVKINIKLAAKKKFIIELTDERFQTATVEWLKTRIEFLEGTPVELQHLFYRRKKLEDGRLLKDYGIKDESLINMSFIIYFIPVGRGNEAGSISEQSGENQSEHESEVEATGKHHKMAERIILKTLTGKNFIIELTDAQIQTATVGWLKSMIQHHVRTRVELQRLIYREKQMENSRLLKYYVIKDDSIIHMGEHKSEVEATDKQCKMLVGIKIEWHNRKIIVKLTDERFQTATVEWLKTRMECGYGIAVELQQLTYNGEQLEDSRLLKDYGIKDESILHMIVRPSFIPVDRGNEAGAMGGQSGENQSEHKSAVKATDEHHKMAVRINIKTSTGKTFIVTLTNEQFQTATVEWLKPRIEFIEGTPVYQQRLVYEGKQLEDDRLLSSYGVKDESVIHLILRLRGGGEVLVVREYGGMGDRRGIYQSMEMLFYF